MRRKRVDPRQLDLFAGQPVPRVSEPKITHEGLYLSPVSAWTGGALNAIEAGRVICGRSIAKGGAIVGEEVWCPKCLRYAVSGFIGIRLYRAVSIQGEVKGETFRCSICHKEFVAHRDERTVYL